MGDPFSFSLPSNAAVAQEPDTELFCTFGKQLGKLLRKRFFIRRLNILDRWHRYDCDLGISGTRPNQVRMR